MIWSSPPVLSRGTDLANWKIPVDSIKNTQSWAVPWSPKDDARLLVGIWKHGFGLWEQIQRDSELGLKGKFFLDPEPRDKDKKDPGTPNPDTPTLPAASANNGNDGAGTPNSTSAPPGTSKPKTKKANVPSAVHLVRRGDYLLLLLRESEGADSVKKEGTAMPRPRKPKHPSSANASGSKKKGSPPASSSKDEARSKTDKAVPNGKRKRKEESDDDSDSSGDDTDASGASIDASSCKELLRWVVLLQSHWGSILPKMDRLADEYQTSPPRTSSGR